MLLVFMAAVKVNALIFRAYGVERDQILGIPDEFRYPQADADLRAGAGEGRADKAGLVGKYSEPEPKKEALDRLVVNREERVSADIEKKPWQAECLPHLVSGSLSKRYRSLRCA